VVSPSAPVNKNRLTRDAYTRVTSDRRPGRGRKLKPRGLVRYLGTPGRSRGTEQSGRSVTGFEIRASCGITNNVSENDDDDYANNRKYNFARQFRKNRLNGVRFLGEGRCGGYASLSAANVFEGNDGYD